MICFGKTKLKYGLFLAPLAGYTDMAMRAVCRAQGAERFVAAAREGNLASNALIRERGFVFDRSEARVDERNGESFLMNWYHRDLT